MAIFSERDGLTVLSNAINPGPDPLYVTRINGYPDLVGSDLNLSVGGSVRINADGTVSFSDTGFSWPLAGNSRADSLIAEVSNGTHNVEVSVQILLNAL